MPAIILKALVPTAIQVQRHPRRGPSGPPLAMRAPLACLLHQPGALQGELHPHVAEPEAVFFPQLLVRVPHVEVRVLVLVQLQCFFYDLKRHTLATDPAWLQVDQSAVTALLVAPCLAHLRRDAVTFQDLRRLSSLDCQGVTLSGLLLGDKYTMS